uniref:Uncharacterized protein n=1 Tax=Arcella intermedia TaxID=1963864 RepID=A0A6B2LUX8_9EUKA
MVIVGNKCDLADERGSTDDQGLSIAEEFNAIWMEVSAKTRKNVEEILPALLRLIKLEEVNKILPANSKYEEKNSTNIYPTGLLD